MRPAFDAGFPACAWPHCGHAIWPEDTTRQTPNGPAHADHYDSCPELDREEGLADMREAVGRR